jgi:hypothetical protein
MGCGRGVPQTSRAISSELDLIRHYFEAARAMSPTAVGNGTLLDHNPLKVMFPAVSAFSTLRSSARLPVFTALAYRSRCASFVEFRLDLA